MISIFNESTLFLLIIRENLSFFVVREKKMFINDFLISCKSSHLIKSHLCLKMYKEIEVNELTVLKC